MIIKRISSHERRRIAKDEKEKRLRAKAEKQTWFAWYPVRVNKNTVVWLQNVTRAGYVRSYWSMIDGGYDVIIDWQYEIIKDAVDSKR